MKLTVTGDRVFIRPDKPAELTESGLSMVTYHHPTATGVVAALGDGPVTSRGIRIPHCVSLGDRVLFPPDAGEELFFETERIIALREEEILAIVD